MNKNNCLSSCGMFLVKKKKLHSIVTFIILEGKKENYVALWFYQVMKVLGSG